MHGALADWGRTNHLRLPGLVSKGVICSLVHEQCYGNVCLPEHQMCGPDMSTAQFSFNALVRRSVIHEIDTCHRRVPFFRAALCESDPPLA